MFHIADMHQKLNNHRVAINGQDCRDHPACPSHSAATFVYHLKRVTMKAVEIIMLPVKDRQASKAFYQQLGFKVIVEAPAAHGETWIQMGLPGDDTTISLSGFSGVICSTDNIENEIKSLKAKGIEVGKIDDTPWGRFAWLKDPDGNSLCLREK
jgi:catechol 2,3-dioxygenase-like lactoylglutathione lyase family enzyme